MEADLLAWLAILATNALTFDVAVDYGRRAVLAGRASGDDKALAAALDGRKTSLAYLGEIAELVPVLAELEPLLRRLGDLFRLHWAIFESGFPGGRGGRLGHGEAALRGGARDQPPKRLPGVRVVARGPPRLARPAAGQLRRRPGARPAGDRDGRGDAARLVWRDLRRTARHHAARNAARRPKRSRCSSVGARLAEQDGAESYRLRCLAPLAQATGSADVLDEADAMLARVRVPAGSGLDDRRRRLPGGRARLAGPGRTRAGARRGRAA